MNTDAWARLSDSTIPCNINEPLNSELRLGEQDWRYRAQDFIRASEAAALKMAG